MKKKTFEIKSGIKLHSIKTELFKTNLVCVIITTPLNEETITKNALIPFILRRGTKELESQIKLNSKLENLYGANFDCGIDKIGDNHVLKFYIESIDNEYAFGKEDVLLESMELLLDIVFNPYRVDGVFNKEYVDNEKETLRKVIESKIDDKDAYAVSQCIYNMYDKTGYGLYKYGDVKYIDEIDEENLTSYYDKLINSCKVDIYVSGNFNEDEFLNKVMNNSVIQNLIPRVEGYILNNEYTESKQIVDNPKEIIENMDVTQGKIIIGLDILSKMENLQATSLVYNTILGDGASSMLFQNVREKAGLAYSTKSSYVKPKANIFIRCGIQIENYNKALGLIKEQLENLKQGNFSEEDIDNAKTFLISGIKNIEEEQDSEIVYYIGQEIAKTDRSLDEYIEMVQKVTTEDIISLANDIQINTIYFLRD